MARTPKTPGSSAEWVLLFAKLLLIGGVLWSMARAIRWVNEENALATPLLVDRVLVWSFTVFTVGAAELFILLIILAIWGRIDLAKVFEDKANTSVQGKDEPPSVSLSRLQAFMWTLVLIVIYFHRVVADGENRLPAVPPEFLMLMGISGAVYLTSKEMDNRAAERKRTLPSGEEGGRGGSGKRPKSTSKPPTKPKEQNEDLVPPPDPLTPPKAVPPELSEEERKN